MSLSKIISLLFCLVIAACGGGVGNAVDTIVAVDQPDSGLPSTSEKLIKINQLGFYPDAVKIAVVPAIAANRFSLISNDGSEVFSGELGSAQVWSYAEENVKLADFSGYTTPGTYYLRVEGVDDSDIITIADNVHKALNQAALKSYYYNRSGTEITSAYGGKWARAAGHPDDQVRVHRSAISVTRPEGSSFASSGGWYDAGDYNKYVVNSGISTYTLLAAYEHFPEYYDAQNLQIPESGNSLPDILDEALWNIQWMLSMQDPEGGGVYHKLTSLAFEPVVMPDQAVSERFVVQKSTGAALNFAAVMAVASRVFEAYETELPGFAEKCRDAAIQAWQWAKNNPDNVYIQPADVSTGKYALADFTDEFTWAAAELYISLQDDSYYSEFDTYRNELSGLSQPYWGQVALLGYMSLLHHRQTLGLGAGIDQLQTELVDLANGLQVSVSSSAFAVVIGQQASDFVWGSNSVALNQSLVLIQAYRVTNDSKYLEAALANLDYVLGRNALDLSFVTGFGQRSPMNIHHRVSEADGIEEPIPGLLAGGPQSDNRSDGCNYTTDLPAKSYLDDVCSYTTNEVAINWNAPLVYVTGALEALH